MQSTKTSEKGITLIALLIMIIIMIIIAAVVLKTITGDEPLIGTTLDTAENYKIESYKEEISHIVHSEIIQKSTIGEIATIENVSDKLNEQDWVTIAYINAEATTKVGNITVQVVEGYIYQVYYNNLYGKVEIDYVGTVEPRDLILTARYEKNVASIFATAEDKKKGIAKIEIIYKDKVVAIKNNPSGEQKFDVSEIGTGWYKVKATSNSGAIKYEWVKAINITDRLTIPEIKVETESKIVNGWYTGKNDKDVAKEVWIKISTKSPSAKEIIYTLSGATIQSEVSEAVKEENGEKYIKIKLENCGPTSITASTGDGEGYQSEPNADTIKYDNIAPKITTSIESQIQGTIGTNDWYKSEEVKIAIEAEDTPAGILDGYVYTITGIGENRTTNEIHQKDITKQITIDKDGEYEVTIQAIDQAGNRSEERKLSIKKDSTKPTIR